MKPIPAGPHSPLNNASIAAMKKRKGETNKKFFKLPIIILSYLLIL